MQQIVNEISEIWGVKTIRSDKTTQVTLRFNEMQASIKGKLMDAVGAEKAYRVIIEELD